MKKYFFIISSVILAVALCLLIYFTSARHFNWEHECQPTPNGHEPYDMDLFDELMERSLHNGYSTKMIAPIDKSYHRSYISSINGQTFNSHHELARANIDTALMVVHRYSWEIDTTTVRDANILSYNRDLLWASYELSPELNLLYFASRGGTALLVVSLTDPTRLRHLFSTLNLDYLIETPETSGYSIEALAERDEHIIDAYIPEKTHVKLDTRYADAHLMAPFDRLHLYSRHSTPKVSELIRAYNNRVYLLDIYYPLSGGHLYITTMMPYFSNLGLRINDGDKVIATVMDYISHKPVVRADYPIDVQPKSEYGSDLNDQSVLLSRIVGNDALYWAWWLTIILILLLLLSGLMRKYPAMRGAELDELDKTDAVAVREYQFRKSPLLHFLFQCSWLYNGNKNYVGIFNADFNRFARVVSRSTGIEFKDASPEQLSIIANYFAPRQHRSVEVVLSELEWMHTFVSYKPEYVTAKQFAYAHSVIENYPLS